MRPILVFLSAVLLLACGGGGGGPPPVTTTLPPSSTLTGYGAFPLTVEPGGSIIVGDDPANIERRGYAGIELFDLPPGARVESAFLVVRYAGSNNRPFEALGDLLIDHLDLGTILDPKDFSRPAFASAFASIGDFEGSSERTIDVTVRLQRDLADGRVVSGYRFRYTLGTNGDNSNNFVVLAGSDSLGGASPTMVVTYRP